MMFTRCLILAVSVFFLQVTLLADNAGTAGKPGSGKHIILVAADNEYRPEEALPQLARILATHHGFRCTVIYSLNERGEIDPENFASITGMEHLNTADAAIIWARFRNFPDEQMQHFDDYLKAGKPIMGLRTSTHAFNIPADRAYARYSFNSTAPGWSGGFGRLVLGETWISHHGDHGTEATRGVIATEQKSSPLTRGCDDIFGPTDVYTVRLPLPDGCVPLVYGQVISGMNASDPPVAGAKNAPMMPIAWTKPYQIPGGRSGRAYATTLGSAIDFESEGVRRLIVAGIYWLTGLEDQIPESPNSLEVTLVGDYAPTPMGGGKHKKGVKP